MLNINHLMRMRSIAFLPCKIVLEDLIQPPSKKLCYPQEFSTEAPQRQHHNVGTCLGMYYRNTASKHSKGMFPQNAGNLLEAVEGVGEDCAAEKGEDDGHLVA